MKKNTTIISIISMVLITLISFQNVRAFDEQYATMSAIKSDWLIDYIKSNVPDVLNPISNYWYIAWKEPDGKIVVEFSPKRYLTNYTGTGTSIYTDYFINYDNTSISGNPFYVVGSIQDSNFVPGWERVIRVSITNEGTLNYEVAGVTGSTPTDLKQANGLGNLFIYTNMIIEGGPKDDLTYPWEDLNDNNIVISKKLETFIYNYVQNNPSFFETDFKYMLSEIISPTENKLIDKNLSYYVLTVFPSITDHKLLFNTSRNEYFLYKGYSEVYSNNTSLRKQLLIQPTTTSYNVYQITSMQFNAGFPGVPIVYPPYRVFPYDENRIYGTGGHINPTTYEGSTALLMATNISIEGGPFNGMIKKLDDLEWMLSNNGNRPLLPPITLDPTPEDNPNIPDEPDDSGSGGGAWGPNDPVPGWGDNGFIDYVFYQINEIFKEAFGPIYDLVEFGIKFITHTVSFMFELVTLIIGSTFNLLRSTVTSFITLIQSLYAFFPNPIRNVANFVFTTLGFALVYKFIRALLGMKGV